MNDSTDSVRSGEFISTFVFVSLLAATAMVGVGVTTLGALMAWLLTLGLLLAVVISAGFNIKGFFFGFLINAQNRYSLSRLQTVCWTMMVLSGYITAVFVNFRADALDPLAIAIPEELWVLMGISMTSLVGSPLLINQNQRAVQTRQTQQARQTQAGEQAQAEEQTLREISRQFDYDAEGKGIVLDRGVAERAVPADATWSDIFQGEDADNFKYLDVSRIQMFYFTFILLVAYGYGMWQMFAPFRDAADFEAIDSLPTISGSMLALLGISHTAYLGSKSFSGR